MPGFAFRLRSLLTLKLAERDRRREALADAFRAEQILERQIEGIGRTIEQTRRGMHRASKPGEVAVDRLLGTHRYLLLLEAQGTQLRKQGERIRAETQRRREALVEADREVRILEKLREKRRKEFQENEAKMAARELDEIALRRGRFSREVDCL